MARSNAAERFKAFISYSQKDAAEARKVQSWLEGFRVPKQVATPGNGGRKLGRIFRDKTDLSASPEVWPELQAQIAASEYLIVLCSPDAAQSIWVDKEIRHFRATSRAEKVLALIISGTPNSDDEATECFPAAFREKEPLAANLVQDGRASALTRVAAALSGLPFDALWQRERRRQRRQVVLGGSLVTLGLGLTAAAVIGGWAAVQALHDASEKRSEVFAQQSRIIQETRPLDGEANLLAVRMALLGDPAGQFTLIDKLFTDERGRPSTRAALAAAVSNRRLDALFPIQGAKTVSSEGRFVLTGRGSNALLQDGSSGEILLTLGPHETAVSAVAIDRSGTQAMTGTSGGAIRLWRLDTGEVIRSWSAHDTRISVLTFSPTGSFAVSGGHNDAYAKLWRLAEDSPPILLPGHTKSLPNGRARSEVRSVQYYVGSDGIFLTSDPAAVNLWNGQNGEEIGSIPGPNGSADLFDVSRDGQYLAIASSGGFIEVWDLPAGGRMVGRFLNAGGAISAICFTPDNRQLIVGDDAAATLWYWRTGERVRAYTEFSTAIDLIRFSADGRSLFLASRQLFTRWNFLTGNPIQTIRTDSGSRDQFLRLVERDGQTSMFKTQAGIVAATFDAGGDRLFFSTAENKLEIWGSAEGSDLEMRPKLSLRREDTWLPVLDFDIFGERLVAILNNGHLNVIDITTGETLTDSALFENQTVLSVSVSSARGQVAAGTAEGQVTLVDIESGDVVQQLDLQGPLYSVAFTPSGDKLVVAQRGNEIVALDLRTMSRVSSLARHDGRISSIAVSPDGQLAISGSSDKTAIIWKLETGVVLNTLDGHSDRINTVAFSSDGQLAATGSDDGLIIIWDVTSGYSVARFEPRPNSHGGGTTPGEGSGRIQTPDGSFDAFFSENLAAIKTVNFDPSGTRLLSGSAGGDLYVWQLPTIIAASADKQVQIACDWLQRVNARTQFSDEEVRRFPILLVDFRDSEPTDARFDPCRFGRPDR